MGRDEVIRINVEINNKGEPAYASKFYATIPLSTAFNKIPNACQSLLDTLLLCDLGKPLYQNKTIIFTIPIDISQIKPDEPFKVVLNVTSLGSDANLSDNIVIMQKEVINEIQISVIGISDPDHISLNEENLKLKKLQLTHTYILQNIGPGTLYDFKLTFLFPQKPKNYEENIFQIFKPDDSKFRCYIVDVNDTYYKKETNNISNGNIPKKTQYNRTVFKESTSNTPLQSALFSKIQNISDSDNTFPPSMPLNGMLSWNCAKNSGMLCIKIECVNEVKLKRFEQVALTFSVIANLKLLEKASEDQNVIIISSAIFPKYDIFVGNWTYAHTLLQAFPRYDYPIKWIVIASVVGIIIFLIVVFILYKAGFFKRHKHEKLLNEKVSVDKSF